MKRYLIISTILCWAAVPAQAQNVGIARLQWNVTALLDIEAGAVASASDKVFTSSTHIQWIDEGGAEKMNLVIDSTSGTWDNINQPGQLVHQVHTGAQRGQVTLQRSGSQYMIRVVLFTQTGDEPPAMVELQVENVAAL